MNLGFTELLLILFIVLLFFGPGRLPGLGRSLGEAIRGFKKSFDGKPDEEPPTTPPTKTSDVIDTVATHSPEVEEIKKNN